MQQCSNAAMQQCSNAAMKLARCVAMKKLPKLLAHLKSLRILRAKLLNCCASQQASN
jgi:NAD/NADP transhydrogenase beta subunit